MSRHFTGMAGEFFVLEKLFRLGHEATITLGNAKGIDIFSKAPNGTIFQIQVKAIQKGVGKWIIGNADVSKETNLFFIFLEYADFKVIYSRPEVYVVPASDIPEVKQPFKAGNSDSYAVYTSIQDKKRIEQYKDAWERLM